MQPTKLKNMKKYYLTKNGNILNTEKGCLQTVDGKFIRRVFESEMMYLTDVLTPAEFPEGLPEPEEFPIWEFLWGTETEHGKALCFTRQIDDREREFCILYNYILKGSMDYWDKEIIDIDIYGICIEEDDKYKNDYDSETELSRHAEKATLRDVYFLGNSNIHERLNRYKILKDKGILLRLDRVKLNEPPRRNKQEAEKALNEQFAKHLMHDEKLNIDTYKNKVYISYKDYVEYIKGDINKYTIEDARREIHKRVRTYDVCFNDIVSRKGFKESFDYCLEYIDKNCKGRAVSIVCNETGETLIETNGSCMKFY